MEKPNLLTRISRILMGAGALVAVAQPVQAFNTSTTYGSQTIRTGVLNNSGRTVNEVIACTKIEDSTKVIDAGFIGLWNGTKQMTDWDGDGTNEVCYHFTRGLGDDFRDGDSADVVFTTSADLNPQTIEAANGETNVNFTFMGPTIDQTITTVPSIDMYSGITATVDANSIVQGPDIDTEAADTDGSVYWGAQKVYNVTPRTNYQIDSVTGCDSLTGDSSAMVCTIDGDGDATINVTSSRIMHQVTTNVTGPITVNLPGGGTCTEATSPCSDDRPEGSTEDYTTSRPTGHSLSATGFDSTNSDNTRGTLDNLLNTRNVSFGATPYSNVINVSSTGTGTGTLVGRNIDTGSGDNTDADDYGSASNSIVATADSGSEFAGWDTCDGVVADNTCAVEYDIDTESGSKTVTAIFELTEYLIQVQPPENGFLRDSSRVIDCSLQRTDQCEKTVIYGVTETITWVGDSNYSVKSFTGSCSGDTCSFVVDGTESVGVELYRETSPALKFITTILVPQNDRRRKVLAEKLYH